MWKLFFLEGTWSKILELAALSILLTSFVSCALRRRPPFSGITSSPVWLYPFWTRWERVVWLSQRAGLDGEWNAKLAPDILGMIVHSPVYAPTASSVSLDASSDPWDESDGYGAAVLDLMEMLSRVSTERDSC
jgi:hypothetical protein